MRDVGLRYADQRLPESVWDWGTAARQVRWRYRHRYPLNASLAFSCVRRMENQHRRARRNEQPQMSDLMLFDDRRLWHPEMLPLVVALRDSMGKVTSESKTRPHRPTNRGLQTKRIRPRCAAASWCRDQPFQSTARHRPSNPTVQLDRKAAGRSDHRFRRQLRLQRLAKQVVTSRSADT